MVSDFISFKEFIEQLFGWFLDGGGGTPHAFQLESESISTLDNLLLSNDFSSSQVGGRRKLVLGDVSVDKSLGNFKSLVVPKGIFGVDLREGVDWVSSGKSGRFSSKVCPVGVTQRLSKIGVVFMENGVP